MTKIICSMGGGFSSTALLPKLLLTLYDPGDIHFVTCVLPNEHPTMWQLFDAVENKLNIKVTYIAFDKDSKYKIIDKKDRTNTNDLFTPFDIFDYIKFLGSSRFDPCSRMLKRETMYNYLTNTFKPEDSYTLAIGISKDEIDRILSIRQTYETLGYKTMFPLEGFDLTDINKHEKIKQWYDVDMTLYQLGFEHNNCSGACIKAGQRQWARLWYYLPDIYMEWENREIEWQKSNRYKTILRRMVDRKFIKLSLKEFREDFLEPALLQQSPSGFLNSYIQELPGGPSCSYCEAI